MKKLLRILQITVTVPDAVLALAFLLIEGRQVLSGDWLLHEQPLTGLFQYLLRSMIAAGVLLYSAAVLHGCGNNRALYFSLCIAAASALLAVLVPNGLGVLFLILALLSVLVNFLRYSAEKKRTHPCRSADPPGNSPGKPLHY